MNRLEFAGLPPSVNDYYTFRRPQRRTPYQRGYGDRILSKEGRAYKSGIKMQCLGRGLEFPPRQAQYIMTMTLVTKDMRKLDISNRIKPIEDALSGIIYPDDKDVWEWHIKRELQRNKPEKTIIQWALFNING